ncbi:hypothetical protein [Streptomyces mayteni]
MTDHDRLLDAALPAATNYPRSSRYHGVPTAVHVTAEGREVPYLKRRLIPKQPTDDTVENVPHTVSAGERLDLLAHHYFGSAGQWWRIADANPATDPRELTDTPGERINIPLPGGSSHGG